MTFVSSHFIGKRNNSNPFLSLNIYSFFREIDFAFSWKWFNSFISLSSISCILLFASCWSIYVFGLIFSSCLLHRLSVFYAQSQRNSINPSGFSLILPGRLKSKSSRAAGEVKQGAWIQSYCAKLKISKIQFNSFIDKVTKKSIRFNGFTLK